MSAAIRLYAPGDLRIESVEEAPAPGPGEVRMRVERAGICGSDLHNFRTGQWISRSPSIPGHEFVARVEAVGDGVAALRVGDRVVADSRVTCGRCPACLAGHPIHCAAMGFVGEVNDGGFQRFVTLPARQVSALADQTLPAEVAVLAEPLAVALHAVNRLGARTDRPVLVVGAGPIGALAALILAHRGVETVMLVDRNARRLDRAAAASGALPVSLGDLPHRPAFAIDATGSAAAVGQTLSELESGGRIALVGLFHGTADLPMNAVVERGLDIVGCAAFDDELGEAIALLTPLADRLACLAAAPVPISGVPGAYSDLLSGESAVIKATIDPWLT
ncbi:MAG: alcohol dehydrogenase catalytic domain-containing protein [Azospirillaceae bacterium]